MSGCRNPNANIPLNANKTINGNWALVDCIKCPVIYYEELKIKDQHRSGRWDRYNHFELGFEMNIDFGISKHGDTVWHKMIGNDTLMLKNSNRSGKGVFVRVVDSIDKWPFDDGYFLRYYKYMAQNIPVNDTIEFTKYSQELWKELQYKELDGLDFEDEIEIGPKSE